MQYRWKPQLSLVVVAASFVGCVPVVLNEGAPYCLADALELEGASGELQTDRVVEIVVATDASTATIRSTDADPEDPFVGLDLQFALAAPIDVARPPVQATFGAAFAGEGSEHSYLRLQDAGGVLFEGGFSSVFDGDDNGGFRIDSPLLLGAVVGPCTNDSVEDLEANRHAIRVEFDDGAVEVDNEAVDGTLAGVDVVVVGGAASSRTFDSKSGAEDGYNPGVHTTQYVNGYLYRRAPSP